jgi:hypothetical protein
MITRLVRINKRRTTSIFFLFALWIGGVLVGCEESSNLIAPGADEAVAPTQPLDDEIMGEGVHSLPTADNQATTAGVTVAAAPTPARPTGLGNAFGDWANIGRGDGFFGSDNVVGRVRERQPGNMVPVGGAEVFVHNKTKNIMENTTTNGRGEFSVDVDAEPGDIVCIHIQWQDAAGNWHVILGQVTLR